MRLKMEDFHAQIAEWCANGMSVPAMANALADLGFITSFVAIRRYCRQVGLALPEDTAPSQEDSNFSPPAQTIELAEESPECVSQFVIDSPLVLGPDFDFSVQEAAELTEAFQEASDLVPDTYGEEYYEDIQLAPTQSWLEFPPPLFVPLEGVWSLEQPLILASDITLVIRDSLEGSLVLGRTGSGKSSTTGRLLAHAFLEAGFGGLVLCVTTEESPTWERYAAECGRGDQLCVFEPGGIYKLAWLDYLSRHPDPRVRSVPNVVECFDAVFEIFGRGGGGRENDGFWLSNRRRLLSNLIRILANTGLPLRIEDMLVFLREAPKSRQEARDEVWRESIVFSPMIERATVLTRGTEDEHTVAMACSYFLESYPGEPEGTRASVEMDFTALADVFNSGTMMDLFGSETTIVPEHIMQGAVVVINLPVNASPREGLIAAAIWKKLTQQAIQRRNDSADDTRMPVFVFIDEAQYFFNHDDGLFQSTARSSRCATVCITQNLPNFYAQVGTTNAEHVVDGYFGNFNLKFFHANSDPTTCQWMANQIGKSRQLRVSGGRSEPPSFLGQLLNPGRGSHSGDNINVNTESDFDVPPDRFIALRCGGPENGFEVDAYLLMGARAYQQIGRHFALVTFQQDGNSGQEPAMMPPPPQSGPVRRIWSGFRKLLGAG